MGRPRAIAGSWQPHRFTILDEVAEADRVCLRPTTEDTHAGEHAGMTARQETVSR